MHSDTPSRPFRIFWFLIGGTAIALGALGAVVPPMPTTLFIILAAFAFGESVPVLVERLEQNRLFGSAITDWRGSGHIARRYKILAVAMMAAALVFGMASSLPSAAKLLQVAVITTAAIFVLSRPSSAKPNPPSIRKHL